MKKLDHSDKRRHERLVVDLPMRAQIDSSHLHEIDMVDISSAGMQIASKNFEAVNRGFDSQHNRAEFEIHLRARMAWVKDDPGGGFLTGWEFDLDTRDTVGEAFESGQARDADDNRRHPRLPLNLVVKAQLDRGAYHEMEMVDVGPSGMQVRVPDFDVVKWGLDAPTSMADFEILIQARLAWVQSGDDDEFLTGWEFNLEESETRIG